MQLINAMLQYAGVEHTSFDTDDIYYMYNVNLYIYIVAELVFQVGSKIKK